MAVGSQERPPDGRVDRPAHRNEPRLQHEGLPEPQEEPRRDLGGSMSFTSVRERADQLRALPLEAVLLLSGARRDRADKAKWHTGRGVISITGAKFMNWNRSVGGGGAIDLVKRLGDH